MPAEIFVMVGIVLSFVAMIGVVGKEQDMNQQRFRQGTAYLARAALVTLAAGASLLWGAEALAAVDLKLECGTGQTADEAVLTFNTDAEWEVIGQYTPKAWVPVFATKVFVDSTWEAARSGYWPNPDGDVYWITPRSRNGTDPTPTTEAYHFRRKIWLDPRIDPKTVTLDGTRISVDDWLNYVGVAQDDSRPGKNDEEIGVGQRIWGTIGEFKLDADHTQDASTTWKPGQDNYLVWKVSNTEAYHDRLNHGTERSGPMSLLAEVKITAQCKPLEEMEKLTCGENPDGLEDVAELNFKTGAGWQVYGETTGGEWQDVFTTRKWHDRSLEIAPYSYTPTADDGSWITPRSRNATEETLTANAYHFRRKIWLDPRIDLNTVSLDGTKILVDNAVNYIGVTHGDAAPTWDDTKNTDKDTQLCQKENDKLADMDEPGHFTLKDDTQIPYDNRREFIFAFDHTQDAGATWQHGEDNYLVWTVSNTESRHDRKGDGQPMSLLANVRLTAQCKPKKEKEELTCGTGGSPDKAKLEYKTNAGWQVIGETTGGKWIDVLAVREWHRRSWEIAETPLNLYPLTPSDGAWISPGHRTKTGDLPSIEAYHFRRQIAVDERIIPTTVKLGGTVAMDDWINYIGVVQDDSRPGGTNRELAGQTSRKARVDLDQALDHTQDGDTTWAPGQDNWLVWKTSNAQAWWDDNPWHLGEKGPLTLMANIAITGECCPSETPQPTPTAAGGQICCKTGQEDDGTGKCADPCTGGKVRQSGGTCACPGDKPDDVSGTCYPVCTGGKVHQDDGACVCPGGSPQECKPGQIVDGECGCKCNQPYEERPYCEDGQVPAPYISKSGSAIDTKAAVVACCKPRPSTSTPVPVNNPWALGLLGAAVAFAAARRRRQSKRRDDGSDA